MCGIAGYSGEFPGELLEVMSQAIARRGPDGQGESQQAAGKVGLVHRRLAILDLSDGGAQPMRDEASGVTMSYNGELYNYRELRVELESLGHRFASQSDSEVVLRAFVEWGRDAFARFNGIFAAAFWDERSSKLTLARDQMGVKPLYLAETPRGIVFASELKALCHVADLDREIDALAVANYLSFLWGPGERTPFRGVKKVAPGHLVEIRAGKIEHSHRFFELPYQQGSLSLAQSEQHLDQALRDAVARQLVADVPVGAFLSGGLDSSAIVALAQRGRGAPLQTFCVDYPETEAKQEGLVRDVPFAQSVSRHVGAELTVIEAEPFSISDLTGMIETLDEPQADPAPLYVGQIAKAAREAGIRVLLSGAGGDDLLTGYRRHRAVQLEQFWSWLPQVAREVLQGSTARLGSSPVARRLTKAFSGAALNADERLENYFRWLSPEVVQQLVREAELYSPLLEFLSRLPADLPPLQKMLLLEQRFFLVDHNLNYTDKLSMKHGVEVRVPLIDLQVVRTAAKIPLRFKQKGAEGKWIFKKVMERYLPHDVIYRPKTGFGAPVRAWIRGPLRQLIHDTLLSSEAACRDLFDQTFLSRLVHDNEAGKVDASYSILSALCIELWLRRFGQPPRLVY